MTDTAQRCIEFTKACLDPERYGLALPDEVLNAARVALGMKPANLRVYPEPIETPGPVVVSTRASGGAG